MSARMKRAAKLQATLALCPADCRTRCELAVLLEELALYDEALSNWKVVISCDPNNLEAREGAARCRQRTGRQPESVS